jgi:uncharacterized Fe-S cluster protein YjdI
MREYKTDQIIVYWFPELCAHPSTCRKLLPKVFDSTRIPWVDLSAATPEEIISCIDQCPSGALRYTLAEGSTVNPALAKGIGNIDHEKEHPPAVEFKITNGQILVEGPVEVIDADGKTVRTGSRMVLCACGKSRNCPFCDGSHRNISKQG